MRFIGGFIFNILSILILCLSCGSMDYGDCSTHFYYSPYEEGGLLSGTLLIGAFDAWIAEGRKADYVFIGDSLIHMWPPKPFEYGYDWMTPFKTTNVINAGIYGDTTCNLMARAAKHTSSFKPKFIMTDGGGNDIALKIPNDVIIANITSYLGVLREFNPDARIVYGEIPPSMIKRGNSNKGTINRHVVDVIRTLGNACFIHLNDFLAIDGVEGYPIQPDFSLDNIHLEYPAYYEYHRRVESAFSGKIVKGVECFDLKPPLKDDER